MWHMTMTLHEEDIPAENYSDVIMSVMASQINGVSTVYSTVCSGADQRKHQSTTSLAFVRGIHWWPVNSPHKGPVTRKMFPVDDVIMEFFALLELCVPIITWWSVLYTSWNSLLRQRSSCFDRKSSSGNSCCWTYPLYKIFRAKIAIKWSVYKLCIQKCYKNWNEIFFISKKILINT